MLGATLKEVRDFYLQQLQNPQLQQPVGTPSTMVTNRQCRRTSRSRGNAAVVSSERVSHRSRKTSRYADPSSSATTSCDLATKNLYFLIPFPRIVFDTEALMETTLSDANLFPRGILTAQFKTKEDSSTSEHFNNPHEFSEPSGKGVQSWHAHVPASQLLRDNNVSRRVEDVVMRERRLEATPERHGIGQGSERATSGTVDVGIAATSMSAPAVLPSVAAASISVARSKERNLEVDGERVRHRELALQAAAKRMTEAAQMFREGFMPDEELAGDICTPSDLQPVPTITSNDEARSIPGNQDCKGKQVADCGTSQPAEVRVQDIGSNIVGLRGRIPRTRSPLPSPSASRPEKLQRIDETRSNSSAGENGSSFSASGHTIDCAGRRGEVQETSPSERLHIGSPGSGSSAVSELKIRLEDGSVLQHTFPAYTTLLSVCEFAIPGRFSTAEHGLILPITGSQFFEGEGLNSTLQQVGLVPRGVVHLQNLTSRGLVTRGRRRTRRVMRYHQRDNGPEPELEQLWQDFSRHMNTNLTYEELVELEDSIGRVNVGVPEATIAELPTHTVSRSAGDICIVCLSEMVEGEEVMVLPCVHTFHPACIRQWLLQSTCCPTCKYYIS
uniref:RING-type E3 ubiquitin transferase n=1 Tax=Physcomitrium patens TaxID=3218 RepID=A0A7I4CQW9_PHYPA